TMRPGLGRVASRHGTSPSSCSRPTPATCAVTWLRRAAKDPRPGDRAHPPSRGAGPVDARRPHYYRLHGPRVLIEYDNAPNSANHIRSVGTTRAATSESTCWQRTTEPNATTLSTAVGTVMAHPGRPELCLTRAPANKLGAPPNRVAL